LVAFGAVLVAATILIGQRYYFHEKLSDYTLVNEGGVLTKEFSVKSHIANQNTSAKGSVFVWGDRGIAERTSPILLAVSLKTKRHLCSHMLLKGTRAWVMNGETRLLLV